jgi:hypothetical protein
MYSMPMAGPEGWEGSSTRPHPLGLDRTCRGYDGFGSSARITKATTHLGPPTSQPNPRPSKTKDVGFHRPTNREKNAHTHTHTHTTTTMPGSGKQSLLIQQQIGTLLEAGIDPTTIRRRLKGGCSSIYRMKRCLQQNESAGRGV